MTCPAGTIGWAPGASSPEQCLLPEEYHDMMSDVSMNIGVLKKLSPRLSKRMMVDAVEACKEKQSLEQGGEGGYPYDLSGVDCDNLGKSGDDDNSQSEAGAELCAEKEKMEKGEAYDYSYDLSSIDLPQSILD